MAYVSLGKMPSHAREYVVDFPQLNGGLNLQELDYRIKNDESPEMKNLWWKDGVLCCREGQIWISNEPLGTYYASYARLWNGKMLLHAGEKIYAVNPDNGNAEVLFTGDGMESGGTFFPYNEKMYYKTKGFYVEISYDGATDTFTAGAVEGYIPVTYINCAYQNGSGTVYQPENRISPKKQLWYDAAYTLTITPSGDLVANVEAASFRMVINAPGTYVFTYSDGWTIGGEAVDLFDFGINVAGTPVNGDTLTVKYTFIKEFFLPEKGLDVVSVELEGADMVIESKEVSTSKTTFEVTIDNYAWRDNVTESGEYLFVYDGEATPAPGWRLNGTLIDSAEYGISVTATEPLLTGDSITVKYVRGDCWYDGDNGILGFYLAPYVYYPEITNTIHITYSKENALAEKNVMDCSIAEVYGGTGALCIVMAGSEDQPNAYFWNGQNSVSMDPTYFPMIQYQLAGDAVDPITAFGKQQGYLIIFKKGSIGRTSLGTETVEGRMTIDLPFVNINAKIGCDLPKTIQLIENNLTWCNTSQGVHFLANTSSAYENNVICISTKVNNSNSSWTMGLINDVNRCAPELVTSHDDEYRYWLIADGRVWLWDYNISRYTKPAWFYFDNVYARGMVQEDIRLWHFDTQGRLTRFAGTYADYDGAIDKVYRFAVQHFGTYDRKKNVNSIILNLRSSTDAVVEVRYQTDLEDRKDLTNLSSHAWSLVPRDLTFRNLEGTGFSKTFRRKPHCRRVRYFTMRLENNTPRTDLAVVSAQIYYIFQGGQR